MLLSAQESSSRFMATGHEESGILKQHFKNNLSIDERLAAHEEARRAVQNKNLFSEDPTEITNDSKAEIDGSSFPHFILQSLQDSTRNNSNIAASSSALNSRHAPRAAQKQGNEDS